MQTDDETRQCWDCKEWFTFCAYAPYKYCPYCGTRL